MPTSRRFRLQNRSEKVETWGEVKLRATSGGKAPCSEVEILSATRAVTRSLAINSRHKGPDNTPHILCPSGERERERERVSE